MEAWTVHLRVDRVPDCIELLDRLAYLGATLRPIDHRECELEVTVRESSYEAARRYAEERLVEARHAIDLRQAGERLRAARGPAVLDLTALETSELTAST
jgi:hypothetical protein